MRILHKAKINRAQYLSSSTNWGIRVDSYLSDVISNNRILSKSELKAFSYFWQF